MNNIDFINKFKQNNILNKLIIINIFVFILIKSIYVILFLLQIKNSIIIDWLALPASINNLLNKPWTIITYMFLHIDFFHILFNLLLLYWFGKLFGEFIGYNKLLVNYILGGISGGLIYILSYNIFPAFINYRNVSLAMGASASIVAIIVAISLYVPNYKVNLILFGNIKIIYIMIFSILIDFITIDQGNPGGKISHIGGALWGYIFIILHKKNIDITNFINNIFKWKFKKKPVKTFYRRPLTDEEYNYQRAEKQKKIDNILDKISRSGYDSLTKEEKELLFKTGKQQ